MNHHPALAASSTPLSSFACDACFATILVRSTSGRILLSSLCPDSRHRRRAAKYDGRLWLCEPPAPLAARPRTPSGTRCRRGGASAAPASAVSRRRENPSVDGSVRSLSRGRRRTRRCSMGDAEHTLADTRAYGTSSSFQRTAPARRDRVPPRVRHSLHDSLLPATGEPPDPPSGEISVASRPPPRPGSDRLAPPTTNSGF